MFDYSIYLMSRSVQYDMIYVCQKCQPGCDTCKDNSPCLSSYNWAFRISLLTFSVICIFLTTMLACYIYKYRKLKVFKVASPIFLCITLLGCAIMYLEVSCGQNLNIISWELQFQLFWVLTWLVLVDICLDGGDISGSNNGRLYCYEDNSTHGLLFNLFSVIIENLAGLPYLSG